MSQRRLYGKWDVGNTLDLGGCRLFDLLASLPDLPHDGPVLIFTGLIYHELLQVMQGYWLGRFFLKISTARELLPVESGVGPFGTVDRLEYVP